jgi:hypothetical protein
MTKTLEYKDKNAKNISVGDILFYSEENYGCCGFDCDSIEEVVDINDDSISVITRIFIPPFRDIKDPKYEEINSQSENVEPFFECPRSIFDSQCYEIIGNIKTDKHKMTVDFAEKNFPIHWRRENKQFD